MDLKEVFKPTLWKLIIPSFPLIGLILAYFNLSPYFVIIFYSSFFYILYFLSYFNSILFIAFCSIIWYFISSLVITQKKINSKLAKLVILVGLLALNFYLNLFYLAPRGPSLGTISDYRKSLHYGGFRQQCQAYCDEINSNGTISNVARFCLTKVSGSYNDFNRNGKVDVIKAETKPFDLCEDGIYCFHVVNCVTGSGAIDWGDCRVALCNAYNETYGSITIANEKV